MWSVTLVCAGVLIFTLESAAHRSEKKGDPVIPTTKDNKFVEFQQAINAKQLELSITALYATMASYKEGFDTFKTTNTVSNQAPTGVDSDFAAFQKFITLFSRTYNNMDEFTIRYGLFLNVLNQHKGYNDGNDLPGINRLSDRTLAEKRAQYGRK